MKTIEQIKVGDICKCNRNALGVVTRVESIRGGRRFHGFRLRDPSKPWQTTGPAYVTSVSDLYDMVMQ